MRVLDRIFGCLMILGGIGHAGGSFLAYRGQGAILLWAFSASFAGFLLAAFNLLRAWRPGDYALAWISFGGCVVWTGFVLWLGYLLGTLFDYRVAINLVIALALAGFSLRDALARKTQSSL